MLRRARLVSVAAALLCAPACAPHAGAPAAQPAHPRAAAAPISSEEDYTSARSEYDALEVGAPDRAERRAALEAYLVPRVRRELDGHHLEDAFDDLKKALSLYDADELAAKLHDTALLEAASGVERAFRQRGAHAEVLTALAVEISLADDYPATYARYEQVVGWLRTTDDGETDGRARVVEDLEGVARLWPSPFVVGELQKLYLEAPDGGAKRARRGMDLRELFRAARPNAGYDLARLYLRISQPKQAQAELARLPDGGDPNLRKLLDRINAPTATPNDAIQLATYFLGQGRDDRDVAARVCRDAARRFPSAPEPRLCAGQLALELDQLVVALKNFEEAVKLQPDRREAWEALAKLYQQRLFQIVSDENMNVGELEKQLRRVEAFHADAQKRFPNQPLKPSMAGALFEVGRGYFNVGRVGDAVRYLERSLALDPSTAALELLGQVRLKKGQPREAAALFERAMGLPQPSRADELYWRAKLRRQMADAFEAIEDAHGAEVTRKAALADWDAFLGFPIEPDYVADAWIEKGKLSYQLGERDDAIAAFEKAIDVEADRGSTYADVIAFLVPRGELDEALDAYHRALGRNEVTDYLKVYCSLWIVDLARRAGAPEDPLAAAYLKSTDGGKWYDDLARWATGREPESALVQHAEGPGRKAEAAFYRGLRAFREGKKDEARALWQQVIDTDMMAFFEYDMAAYYLKAGGAPSQPVLKSKPQPEQKGPPRRSVIPPDGSI